mmetsp:Transcript_30086/g.56448  ORF Transcript_30086/g.56448 Transcript_30086/m.56448 type:complete len:314 (+) Transcript_30086:2-943(+)
MNDRLEKVLEEAGLIIIDHRFWHTLGLDAVHITEIFCQDKHVQVKIPGCFSNVSKASARRSGEATKDASSEIASSLTTSKEGESSEDQSDSSGALNSLVSVRKEEIRELISNIFGSGLDPTEYAIQVTEWETFAFNHDVEESKDGEFNEETGYYFHMTPHKSANIGSVDGQNVEDKNEKSSMVQSPSVTHVNKKMFNRSKSNASAADSVHEDPCLTGRDLWDTDAECHHLAREGYYQAPTATDGSTTVNVEEGCHHRRRLDSGHHYEGHGTPSETPQGRNHHKRSHTFDASLLDSYDLETYTIKERLHGWVRP